MQKTILRVWLIGLALGLFACGKKEPEKPPAPTAGEVIWTKNCKVCHAQGILGAPIIGNKVMWEPRLTQGIDTLYQHAINGFGQMPAKGGNTELPDADVKLAVEHMVSKVQ